MPVVPVGVPDRFLETLKLSPEGRLELEKLYRVAGGEL